MATNTKSKQKAAKKALPKHTPKYKAKATKSKPKKAVKKAKAVAPKRKLISLADVAVGAIVEMKIGEPATETMLTVLARECIQSSLGSRVVLGSMTDQWEPAPPSMAMDCNRVSPSIIHRHKSFISTFDATVQCKSVSRGFEPQSQ